MIKVTAIPKRTCCEAMTNDFNFKRIGGLMLDTVFTVGPELFSKSNSIVAPDGKSVNDGSNSGRVSINILHGCIRNMTFEDIKNARGMVSTVVKFRERSVTRMNGDESVQVGNVQRRRGTK
jgi:hypothetical protein